MVKEIQPYPEIYLNHLHSYLLPHHRHILLHKSIHHKLYVFINLHKILFIKKFLKLLKIHKIKLNLSSKITIQQLENC
jgi:hypothetical protein